MTVLDIKLDGLLTKKIFIKDALNTFRKSTENEIAQQQLELTALIRYYIEVMN